MTSLQEQQQCNEEISQDYSLRSLLKNEELSDLTVRGSDGSLVLANRCIDLPASRSAFFRRMENGGFQETTARAIRESALCFRCSRFVCFASCYGLGPMEYGMTQSMQEIRGHENSWVNLPLQVYNSLLRSLVHKI